GRAQARARHEEFLKRRDEALLSDSQVPGLTASANLTATRTAARRALELFAVPPGPEDGLSEGEQAEIATGCYELLLILARAVAQPLEGEDAVRQADEALRLLDRAATLRPPTRALHLCRAACLARRNDMAAAAQETARAQALEPADAVDYFLLGD